MWCQSGFQPDSFWQQTPATFQACIVGVRARLEGEAENRVAHAWTTGVFTAQAQAGKLKPLDTILKKPPRKMSNQEMLANMRILAQRANAKT